MTFRDLNLNTPLLNALDELGFIEPTPIQQKVFSVTMSGRDVCGIAQTGTGKTFAYLLPSLRQLKYSKEKPPQMLIIVPTRELVVQVVDAIKSLTTYMTLRVSGVYGGVNMKPQMAAMLEGLDILVATPGRLYDLVLSGSLKLKNVKRLVIDEVDEMLNLGFRPQLMNILDLLPTRRQNLLFSATITEEVEQLIEQYFNNPERIEAARAGTPLENISQVAYLVPNFNTKVNLLHLLLNTDQDMTKVLIFTATKQLADQLFEQLETRFPEKVGVIHSNKEQKRRFETIQQFQAGNYQMIIATDVIARGIDVAEVSHVINFDIPEVPENYIHRIGRTGRADRKGIAVTLVTERETEQLEAIEALMNYQIPQAPLPANLEISTVLTEDEIPKVAMRNTLIKPVSREGAGAAFHEKLAKNKKVNRKVSHADKMKLKYGKPKTRGAKRK
ncbi:DEAD/DEAH box helicase [Chitinophaga pendula]|uniref:DEAD/DEAH box helicase n=1 Tax=Chitinophaga TaxID=79328 RepID=UPI000BB0C421|nr:MULTISPECIES: DEAD/DEAH box helicase [Chitinophaga]ASZ11827.1 DEAD/DEAH box helicase [Chitinophaga sp. MD30]UCJ05152.1 DEAD/DEAH box helicase [Chitinophaga pendula]